jgi:hypothetical protein
MTLLVMPYNELNSTCVGCTTSGDPPLLLLMLLQPPLLLQHGCPSTGGACLASSHASLLHAAQSEQLHELSCLTLQLHNWYSIN